MLLKCPWCAVALDQPTAGSPEEDVGFCRQCHVVELSSDYIVGQLFVNCQNGLEQSDGEGGAPPRAKRAKLEPATAMSTHEEVQRCSWRGRVCELAGHLLESCEYEPLHCPNVGAGCKELMLRKDTAHHVSETCAYRQKRCAHCHKRFTFLALPGHEASCPEGHIECPNARCGVMVARRGMAEHRLVCEREEVACPFPGCEVRVARAGVREHVQAAGAAHAWNVLNMGKERAAQMEEKVAEQNTSIALLQQQVGLQGTDSARQGEAISWLMDASTMLLKKTVNQDSVVAALQNKVGEQGKVIANLKGELGDKGKVIVNLKKEIDSLWAEGGKQRGEVALLRREGAEQGEVVAGLQRRANAHTHVFTWSTDSSWSSRSSLLYNFADGVAGYCSNSKAAGMADTHFMGFVLKEGPAGTSAAGAFTMHFESAILDKDDNILRVLNPPETADFQKPPIETAPKGNGKGVHFKLMASNTVGAVGADGSIKLRMVVHLYLP
ncbi:hypothetical protein T484DRAFT_1791157 [Baffinella frigidus]|nr:hypothetical protein T484DRAFT_1791157 [Cryptophyta sp. CCMP2293]